LASLEGGKHGLAFASGSAVTATIMTSLGPQSHIVSVNDVYGGSYRYFTKVASQAQGIETTFVELGGQEDSVVANLKSSIRDNTKLVWIETPTNPTLRLIDIALVAKTVKSIRSDIAVVVDSTFLSPWYQTPLSLGADIVVHSITKYINGHSDVVMGALVTNDSAWFEKLKFLQNSIGAVPSAFDSWLALRGLKTLAVRMQAHGISALTIAKELSNHPAIEEVIYPGLPSYPSFALALRQINPRALEKATKISDIATTGFPYGGMVTIRLKSDAKDDRPANRFLESLKIFSLAESLGGVESLIELPSKMTHAAVSEEDRAKLG
jgi:cystathionine gamma-lyase